MALPICNIINSNASRKLMQVNSVFNVLDGELVLAVN